MAGDPVTETQVYFVTSPEYDCYIDYVPEFGTGPRGTTRDWKEIVATSKREAVSIAVREWLAERRDRYALDDNWCSTQRADGLCPFTGIRAELAVCGHGVKQPADKSWLTFDPDCDEWWCSECHAEFLRGDFDE